MDFTYEADYLGNFEWLITRTSVDNKIRQESLVVVQPEKAYVFKDMRNKAVALAIERDSWA